MIVTLSCFRRHAHYIYSVVSKERDEGRKNDEVALIYTTRAS